MSSQAQPSPASLRRLWRQLRILQLAVLLLALAVAGEGWLLLRRPAPVAGLKPPLPAGELASEQAFLDGARSQTEQLVASWRSVKLPYALETIEALGAGESPWLQAFAAEQGLDAEATRRLGQVLAQHCLHMNEVLVAEARGSHAPADTALFVKTERTRLLRSLVELLGSERAAALQVLVERELPPRD